MSVIILRNNLKEALEKANRALGEASHLPVLKNFLIKAENNNLIITSTNLELGITVYVPAKIIEPGYFMIPASVFSSLISNITSERLDIQIKDSNLEIKADNYEAEIPILNSEDFPIIPDIENKNKFIEFNSSFISEAFNQIISTVQFSEIRPEISGILFDFQLNELTLVGTDSFRLAEKKISNSKFKTNFDTNFKFIIPIKTIHEFIRVFKKDEIVKFYFDENQILFKSNTVEIISRLIEGNFPDYKAIIPKNFETEIEINKNDFMNSLKLSGVLNPSIYEIKIIIKSGKKNIEVLSTEKSFGKAKSTLLAKIKGKDAEILFNWRYFFDGLKNFKDEAVFIGLNDGSRPALIKSEDITYLYILMPIKQ
ncbi:MAG: DNA polymerase III subunit beta [Candidatus Liptonbacteria bacterium]|nr:DNA polymerase III subunit beta [Candidatus Liptonbacteria bacterium]